MASEILTRHNPLLSRPTKTVLWQLSGKSEDNFTSDLNPVIAKFVNESLSDSTRLAYLSDLRHFENWGGSIPAASEAVATYIAEHASTLAVSTIVRRVAAISKAHAARGLSDPTKNEVVRATLRGMKRIRGGPQKEAAPLMRDQLFQVLDAIASKTIDERDRALLLIGFAGGFRRSELVALNWEDVEFARQGVVITIRRSKTDQFGAGRKLAVPYGRTRHCPVRALEAWLSAAAADTGPLFRRVDRHGNVRADRISGEAVSLIIRERLKAASIDPSGYSSHSLRAGFATSAAQASIPTWQIRRQTGHASDAVLARYIRMGELFIGNAAGSLL